MAAMAAAVSATSVFCFMSVCWGAISIGVALVGDWLATAIDGGAEALDG
jgi:hypothetical protein